MPIIQPPGIKRIASSTDGNVPQWDGTTGGSLKDGLVVGTAANNLVQLNASAELPAVSGANLTGLPAGTGNTIAPATNTANSVPQWNGADSKTLKDGLAVGTAANNLVQLDANGDLPVVGGGSLNDTVGFVYQSIYTCRVVPYASSITENFERDVDIDVRATPAVVRNNFSTVAAVHYADTEGITLMLGQSDWCGGLTPTAANWGTAPTTLTNMTTNDPSNGTGVGQTQETDEDETTIVFDMGAVLTTTPALYFTLYTNNVDGTAKLLLQYSTNGASYTTYDTKTTTALTGGLKYDMIMGSSAVSARYWRICVSNSNGARTTFFIGYGLWAFESVDSATLAQHSIVKLRTTASAAWLAAGKSIKSPMLIGKSESGTSTNANVMMMNII